MSSTTRFANSTELHDWIEEHLGFNVPQKPICPHHQAPIEYLWKAYTEPGPDLIAWAPRGGGKTTLGAIATLLDLLHKPSCQIRILGGSLEQSLRMWEHLLPMVENHAQDQLTDDRSRSRKISFKNGSAAAVLTQSQRSVRGQRVQKLRCDEVELFDREIWTAAQLVTRSRTQQELPPEQRDQWPEGIRARIEALSTMHAPYGLMQELVESASMRGVEVVHWCLLDVLEKCPEERPCQGCALEEDCHGAARAGTGFFRIDDAIAMKHRVSRETWEAEILCRRPSREAAVFPSFKGSQHVNEQAWWPVDRDLKRTLAVDFGFRNPFVCLWVLSDRQGRVYVFDEIYLTEQTLENLVGMIRSKPYPGFDQVCCDPAGNQPNHQTSHTNVAVLRKAGFTVHTKGTRVQDGIDEIRTALNPAAGESTLRIHPRCTNLIRSMELYHYEKKRGNEVPLKDNINDHCIDALRYFYMNRHADGGSAGEY
jgi:Terminase RNaseH-like domain